MMNEALIAGFFGLILALLEMIKWAVKRGEANAEKAKCDLVYKQTQDLWDWHNKDDDEGVKLWYVRKSLEDAIIQLSQNIGAQTDLLREMVTGIREIKRNTDSQH